MKLEELGINPKTGAHNLNLTTAENRFLGILWVDHVGRANAIPADMLAMAFDYARSGVQVSEDRIKKEVKKLQGHPAGMRKLGQLKRDVRTFQNHLVMKHKNIPVLSAAGAGGGYWIAETREEADEFYAAFRARGLTGLVKAARGKQSTMVDIVEQLTFEFEELVDKTGGRAAGPPPQINRDETPLAIEVVDSFLQRMLQNPEKFSEGLKMIGKKYGSVLLPKGAVERVKAEAERLQRLIAEL